ncbi:MAG TPA: Nramp family divalent metal transporter [Longimicrobium sp.]|jgi:NRAMP (natural resistance-associated macrophage protein)-like metal ion transporter
MSSTSRSRKRGTKAPARPEDGKHRLRGFFRHLGPGLITGAADDDPSGVSTYSTAGAQFGFALLWTAPAVLPLMSAVQLMCARVGMCSGRGLSGVLRAYYPRWVLWASVLLLLVANTVNIGADLGAMAAVSSMLTGVPSLLLVPVFAAAILALLVFASYPVIARVFKWLTLVLFAYVASAFLARPDWGEVLRSTVLPRVAWDREYLLALVAILGTTISPYLFFWQAAEEVEEEKAMGRTTLEQRRGASERALRHARTDTVTGMTVSVVVFYFIVLTTGATLHARGITDIQTAEQAAQALRPLAGSAASLLFSLGIVGTGMLGVPVLAGSAALAVAEAEGWPAGMSERPTRAGRFYAVMALALGAGMAMDYLGIEPIRMLFGAAVVNGLLAPPLIFVILLVCNDRRVMGEHTNGFWLNALGLLAGLLMAGAAVALLLL